MCSKLVITRAQISKQSAFFGGYLRQCRPYTKYSISLRNIYLNTTTLKLLFGIFFYIFRFLGHFFRSLVILIIFNKLTQVAVINYDNMSLYTYN